MRILAVDVGTGTQDILLFDTSGPVENCVKLVMPSPTTIAASRIRHATAARQDVILTGVIQGGGPCHWALEDHLRARLPAYATPEAATTFDDDPAVIRGMGIRLVTEDESRHLEGTHIHMRDLDLDAIAAALHAFAVDAKVDGYAVGCLDHGAAPPGYSDRLFRFDHLRRVLEGKNDLTAFAYLPSELPEYLTRARTLVAHLPGDLPAVFLDTGPAAALGALLDPIVGDPERRARIIPGGVINHEEQYILNLGNMHALAFHLRGTRIVSLYEHHTGEMTNEQIEDFTKRLATRELRHEEVFESKGHGVYYTADASSATGMPFLAVTGPQRGRLHGSSLKPYFAAPHGDMMLTGCFGMLRGFAARYPEHADEIEKALAS